MSGHEELHYDVLDKGFVRLVDFMGGDIAVVEAARVSFGQGSKGEKKDRLLIDYLLGHGHETPFEQSVFKFHVKCPIFVSRQWFRHRWSSYNEISGRYTEFKEEFYVPDHLRTQAGDDYRFSLLDGEGVPELRKEIEHSILRQYELYQRLLAAGVAKEQARVVLPVSMYTQFYWSVNARSLMNFIKLRDDEHAQHEIRQYARSIREIFAAKMPWTYEAFNKYNIGVPEHVLKKGKS
jgi:thymidylate synthase (FAD)